MSDGKTAFVLAGGGSLGAVQVGMLEVLADAGVKPDIVVGSSVRNSAMAGAERPCAGAPSLCPFCSWTDRKQNAV